MITSALVYTQKNTKYLQIGPVTDALTGLPVVGATVVATLYAGVSAAAGVPVSGASNITLNDQGAGIYQGTLGGSSFVPQVGTPYVTVIDFTSGASSAHWELPSVVTIRS